MKTGAGIPVLVVALGLGACVPDVQGDAEAIKALDAEWGELVAAGEVGAIVALYAGDGLLMAPNEPAARGAAALRPFWERLAGQPGIELKITPSSINVAIGGDLAADIGTYSLSFDGADGRVEDRGKYVVVWRKIAGEWKVAADIFNSDLAAP